MYFKQFLHDDLGCSSYFIASRESREAAVIDPHRDVQQYLDLATERGYKIVAVVDTHLHADHVSGNRDLAAATGAQLYFYEGADILFPFQPLNDGDEISLGQVILRVVHTPGHRPEGLSCWWLTQREAQSRPWCSVGTHCSWAMWDGRTSVDRKGPDSSIKASKSYFS